MLVTSLLLRPFVRRFRRGRASGQCPACGYDLTRNVSSVCPECGWRIVAGEAN